MIRYKTSLLGCKWHKRRECVIRWNWRGPVGRIATGVCYYKLTDNNPAASWASVDWYGVPKIAYHILRGAYRPVHACVLFSRLSFIGVSVNLPVFLLDDVSALAVTDWQVKVRAFGSDLELIEDIEFKGAGTDQTVNRLGELRLDADQTWNCPLFIVAEITSANELIDRVFYWLNYTSVQGCLFSLPPARLSLDRHGSDLISITNTGDKPAVGVHFVCPDISDHFHCDDSYFWLDPGEERQISVSQTNEVSVAAWNADESV